jgi:hypothetical protein
MESLKNVQAAQQFLRFFVSMLGGPIIHLLDMLIQGGFPAENDHSQLREWAYEVGDRVFTYSLFVEDSTHFEEIFVFKRDRKIYMQGDLSKELLPKFQQHFGVHPFLSEPGS